MRPQYEKVKRYTDQLIKDYQEGSGRRAVRSFRSRIKPEDSFLRKVNTKGVSGADIWEQIRDIVGLRIVTLFHEDKKKVEEEFINPIFDVDKCHKYEYPDFWDMERTESETLKVLKEGYMSWHYEAKLKEEHIAKGVPALWVEIQLRTMLEDTLAEFTHEIYKTTTELPDELRRNVTSMSRHIFALDRHLQNANKQYLAIRPYLPGEPTKDLSGADLSGKELSNVDFSRYNLREANFENAQLLWCAFNEADLTGAILRNARVLWPKMRGVKLAHSDLTNADFSYASLKGASFRNADLREAQFIFNYYFEEADFTDANMKGTRIARRHE